MFRMWVKLFENNHMLKDITIANDKDDTRTHKILSGLEEACLEFDLPKPIWLDSNIREFKQISKTRFTRDSFVENVEFDYMEIHVIEEDDFWG